VTAATRRWPPWRRPAPVGCKLRQFVSAHDVQTIATGGRHHASRPARRRRRAVVDGHVAHPHPGAAVKLKGHYSSREVAAETGLTARQLQWWDRRGIFAPAVPTHKTEAGGYTERRYTPIELIELKVLADLRRRGFSVGDIRRLLATLRSRFKARLFDAVEDGGGVALFVDGRSLFARTPAGEYFNLLENPRQPLLVLDEPPRLRRLTARAESARPRGAGKTGAGAARRSAVKRPVAG